MTTAQKIIKYLAMAFAIFLIVTIIFTIVNAVCTLFQIFYADNKTSNDEFRKITFQENELKNIDIDIKYGTLTIKTGESISVDTNMHNITCIQNNQTLQIKQNSNLNFSKIGSKEIIIYLPDSIEFDNVNIEAGAGDIQIQELNTKEMFLELGAGKTEIQNLNVLNNAEIEGGAGKLTIKSGSIKNLDFDMGVGEANFCITLLGKSELDAGVGDLNIDIVGIEDDYKIKVDKGIGSISLDENKVENNTAYGNGKNIIDVNGGIGNIKINFK